MKQLIHHVQVLQSVATEGVQDEELEDKNQDES